MCKSVPSSYVACISLWISCLEHEETGCGVAELTRPQPQNLSENSKAKVLRKESNGRRFSQQAGPQKTNNDN